MGKAIKSFANPTAGFWDRDVIVTLIVRLIILPRGFVPIVGGLRRERWTTQTVLGPIKSALAHKKKLLAQPELMALNVKMGLACLVELDVYHLLIQIPIYFFSALFFCSSTLRGSRK